MNHFGGVSTDILWPLMWLDTYLHHCVIKPERSGILCVKCCTEKWLTPATVTEYVPFCPSNRLKKGQIIFLKLKCLSQWSLVVMSFVF